MKKFILFSSCLFLTVTTFFSCSNDSIIERPIPMVEHKVNLSVTKSDVDISITKGFVNKEKVNYEVYNSENVLVSKGETFISNNGNNQEFILNLPSGNYKIYSSNKTLINKVIVDSAPNDENYYYSVDIFDVVPSVNNIEIELTRIVSKITINKNKFDNLFLTVSTYHFTEFCLDTKDNKNNPETTETLSKEIVNDKFDFGYIYPSKKQMFRFDIINEFGVLVSTKTLNTEIIENKMYTINVELNTTNNGIHINTSWNGSEDLKPEL